MCFYSRLRSFSGFMVPSLELVLGVILSAHTIIINLFTLSATRWQHLIGRSQIVGVLLSTHTFILCKVRQAVWVLYREQRARHTPSRRGTQCLVQCKQLGERRARAVVCGKCWWRHTMHWSEACPALRGTGAHPDATTAPSLSLLFLF